ncbi:hypothetical protein [Sporocytophaga myxococcoides]|uniref:hypothetical protein n=1 Tax=Sporocytophaga myxococcoides TaxID=153721 RepID=UPI000408F9D8|nr:hypothetical protein [Sporocytophaga myxococcoides]
MVPSELLTLFSSLDFEEGGSIKINSCKWIEENLYLELNINSGSQESSEQLWEIIIEKIKEEAIQNTYAYSIDEYNEHPLLLEFNDTPAELYSNSVGENHDKLVIEIIEIHSQKFGDWIPLDKYLNKCSEGLVMAP